LKEAQAVSGPLGLQIRPLEITNLEDFDNAFTTATKEKPNALTMTLNLFINTYRPRILDFVAKNRLPAIFGVPDIVEAGGRMSYGPDYSEHFRRLATYVDKILKGAKAADLPVEQPTKFEFMINLKAAKQIDLTIPPNLVARANKVIK
jgi:putative tryptophan/tyrosine transport system substrate-binding protein